MINAIYIILGLLVLLAFIILFFCGKTPKGQDAAGAAFAFIYICGFFFVFAFICGSIALGVSLITGVALPSWLKILGWVIASPVILLIVFELGLAIIEKIECWISSKS